MYNLESAAQTNKRGNNDLRGRPCSQVFSAVWKKTMNLSSSHPEENKNFMIKSPLYTRPLMVDPRDKVGGQVRNEPSVQVDYPKLVMVLCKQNILKKSDILV